MVDERDEDQTMTNYAEASKMKRPSISLRITPPTKRSTLLNLGLKPIFNKVMTC
jgi:hypothetical protein